MGAVLVVDGADICRAPIVEHLLRTQLGAVGWLRSAPVLSRGLDAEDGRAMCGSAASKIGLAGPAVAFSAAHRARRLTAADVAGASLVLTAERQQRAAVLEAMPGAGARVFTVKEALVLATVLADRVRNGLAVPPRDLTGLAQALHGSRGTVPLIEPAVRTGVFHWRRAEAADPLSVADGHEHAEQHRRTTQESFEVAHLLCDRLLELTATRTPVVEPPFEPLAEAVAGPPTRRRLRA